MALYPALGPLAAVIGSAIGAAVNGGTWKSFAIGVGIGIAAGYIAGAMGFSGPDMFAEGFKFTTETILQGVFAGAVTGAVAGAISSAVYGGNWGNNMLAGALGGAIGAGVGMATGIVFGNVKSSIGTSNETNTPRGAILDQCDTDLVNQRTGEMFEVLEGYYVPVVGYQDGIPILYIDEQILDQMLMRDGMISFINNSTNTEIESALGELDGVFGALGSKHGRPPEAMFLYAGDGVIYQGQEMNYALQAHAHQKLGYPYAKRSAIVHGWKALNHFMNPEVYPELLPSKGTMKWYDKFWEEYPVRKNW